MMKTAELRQAILQAAVQGKLVPQNPQDEPASILSERIRQEKLKLMKEGKIKKEKPLPHIAEEEKPYDLPEGWGWCRLGDITTIFRGASPRPKGDPRYWDEHNRTPYHWIKISDITKYTKYDVLYDTDEFLTEEGKELSVYVNKDFVITAASGSIGKCAILEIDGYIYDGLIALRIYDETINKRYMVSFISAVISYLVDESTGTSWKNIKTDTLKTILFPLPPFDEQQRIVAKINELMALCDELEAAEKELDELESNFFEYLPKSILQAAVQGKLVPQNIHDEPATELLKQIQQEKKRLIHDGKIKKEKPLPPISEDEVPYDLPDGWVWCRLSDIGEIVGGATPLTTEPTYYTQFGKGIAWITPADMKNSTGNMISRGKKDITIAGYESCSTKLLPTGSVIFSSRAPIGLIAFAKNELCTNQGFKSVIPYQFSVNSWIFYVLKHMTGSIIARASGTTFLEVSGGFMRKEVIPLPPLVEQQRIVAKVDKLMSLCDELKDAGTPASEVNTEKVIPLPKRIVEDDYEEIGMAARGVASQQISEKLQNVIDDWDDGDD